MLCVKRARVTRYAASRGHVQQEGGEGGAHPGPAGIGIVLPCEVTVEIELARVPVAKIGVLQHPEFTAIAESMIAMNMRQSGAQSVIGCGVKALGLSGAEVTRHTGDVRETRPRQLADKARRKAQRRFVETRPCVVPRLLVASKAVPDVEDLGGADHPDMVQADALVDPLGKASGRYVIQPECVARVFDQVVPA